MNKFFSYCFLVCCISILFSCQKEVSVETYSALTASGSLWDSAGACLPDSVYGTFYDGVVAGSDTAYVEIQVNVTQTGSYNISSDLQDGFLFADSGFFSSTGINIVRLKPSGVPIIPTTAIFNISFDSSFCSFSVNIQDSTGTGLGGQKDTTGTGDTSQVQSGQWQFTQGAFTYSGTFDSASRNVISGITFLDLNGSTSTGDTAMNLQFFIPGSDIAPGTYSLISNGIQFSVDAAGNVEPLFVADAFTVSATDMTIVVTSYNTATKTMVGTFSGNAQIGAAGSVVPITNGSFTATVP